jgi:hypothetical protein
MQNLRELVEADKRISAFPGWSEPEDETGYSYFNAPLEIGGVTEVGFVLHGGCYPSRPQSEVSFEMRVGRTVGRKKIPLERLDWRAATGHTNPLRRDSPLSGRRVGPTHLHAFEPNWSETEGRMRYGALRMAQNIEEELPDFVACRAYVGKRFRISNIELVSEPNWVYDLLQWGLENDG